MKFINLHHFQFKYTCVCMNVWAYARLRDIKRKMGKQF